jgi:hypothetical protein
MDGVPADILAGTMKNAVLPVGALLVVLGGVGATVHHVYETHLSSGYAPILKAALDMHASEADEASYLRQARLAIRTDKDQETNDKLSQAFEYAAENCEEQFKSSMQLSDQSIRSSMNYGAAMQRHEFERGSAEEKAAYAKSTEISDEAEAAGKAYDRCRASEEKDTKLALALFQELRATAGLPPLKPQEMPEG